MQVYCLGWDCEGQKLASASIDKTVRVWNIEHRHKVLPTGGYCHLFTATLNIQVSLPSQSSINASVRYAGQLWGYEKHVLAHQRCQSIPLIPLQCCRTKMSGMRASSSILHACTACIGTPVTQQSW